MIYAPMREKIKPDVCCSADGNGSFSVTAEREFVPDELIIMISGIMRRTPTRTSIQLGVAEHIEDPIIGSMNHSCNSGAYIHVMNHCLRAAHIIRRGEEITINYNASETSLACPFRCRCGTADCVGLVRGYRFLSPEQKRTLKHLAPHLCSEK